MPIHHTLFLNFPYKLSQTLSVTSPLAVHWALAARRAMLFHFESISSTNSQRSSQVGTPCMNMLRV